MNVPKNAEKMLVHKQGIPNPQESNGLCQTDCQTRPILSIYSQNEINFTQYHPEPNVALITNTVLDPY